MTIAVNVRMKRRGMKKNDLRGLHGVMFGKLNLKLVGFISVEGPWSSIYFNNPPLEIIGGLMFETRRWVDLPLRKLFLKAIASNLTQSLASGGG